ncbi:ABC transporter substrate-binding protein [uncultured Endozoicomonas sp.]|uniref:ABC transporter substrate-binding protein n=1 Tax=uncultured Endozoicomonas sp. TaxID=432652 RepID=UPI002618DBAC|nr:ABC transporter substrate-binding protein [uncultured Endozoicomonas sp.]
MIRIGVVELGSGAVILLGDNHGFFSDNDILLDYVKFDSAQQIANAVASGVVDIGVAGLTAGLFNLAAKGKFKIIAGNIQDESTTPSNTYVVSNAVWGKGIRKPSDLSGLRFGVTDIGSTPHYMAAMVIEKYKMTASVDAQFIALGSMSAMKVALEKGNIDCAVIPEYVAQ